MVKSLLIMNTKFRNYLCLTKPGMVRGNVIVAAAAYLFGAAVVDWQIFTFLCIGMGCIVGSACAFNNYYDRFIDAKMERTKNRSLASGRVSVRSALVLGFVLLIVGTLILYTFTNTLTLVCALVGFAVYVFAYTPFKHMSGHALWVGAVAGAMPPVAGYVAATNTLDTYAFILFLFLFIWQIPHFVAIALYRFSEYQAAGVPLIIKNRPSEKTQKIAKKVFRYSLVVLLLFCVVIAIF